MKRTIIWIAALVVGAILGLLGIAWLDEVMNFVATVYTRLFQLLAVPTIVLAVITTFATFGSNGSGKIFGHTLTYTLLTTFAAAAVGAALYVIVAPGLLPLEALSAATVPEASASGTASYADHLLSVIPNNIVRPFLEGNVLSLLLLAFALIRWLIWTLPLGIVAFSAQLSAQVSAGVVADSIGKYVLVVLGGNVIQFFVVLPLFLLAKGLNPVHVLGKMMPAVLMALFTKSSAATLPVTMETAEKRLGIKKNVARFVLPICTTINMNGCAAFILVTSLFVMQQDGTELSLGTILLWLLISVVSAVGNAGVPMGCFFLTLSLMSGIGAPVAVLGIILPIYTIIDMVETAENVWSDSCVSAMVDRDFQ